MAVYVHARPAHIMTPAPDKTPSERWLVILLRIAGSIMLLAFGAVLMPSDWMAAWHRGLGLGEFPASPIVDYLTRSASALYGIYGGLYWTIAGNVRRYAGILKYLASMNIGFGILMLCIGINAGLPWYWVMVEGPPVALFAVLLLFLLRDVPEP